MRSAEGSCSACSTHPRAAGDRFDEYRTGLDHVAFACRDRDELRTWIARLDELGIIHGGIKGRPLRLRGLLSGDPDGIALEFFAPPVGDLRPATREAILRGVRQALGLREALILKTENVRGGIGAQERMLYVRDMMPGPREALAMRLITGLRLQTEGRAGPGLPPSAGACRLVKGPMVRPDISNGTSRGPASCGPARLAALPGNDFWWSEQDIRNRRSRRQRQRVLLQGNVVRRDIASGMRRRSPTCGGGGGVASVSSISWLSPTGGAAFCGTPTPMARCTSREITARSPPAPGRACPGEFPPAHSG